MKLDELGLKKAIGLRIKSLRGRRSQKDFARLMECSHQHISALESGRSFPSIQFLIRLKELAGRSYTWILTGEEEETVRPSRRAALEKEPPHIVSKIETPDLYRLVTLLKESRPKEIARFVKMALAYFEEEQKKR